MGLRSRLLWNHILVLAAAAIAAAVVCYGYSYLGSLFSVSLPKAAEGDIILLLENGELLHSSVPAGTLAVKALMMDLGMGKKRVSLDEKSYDANAEEFHSAGKRYTFIRLTPKGGGLSVLHRHFAVGGGAFLLAYLAGLSLLQSRYRDNILLPLSRLRSQTDLLRDGELDTVIDSSGYPELRELGNAVEQLRIKLKDAVYYRQRADDNRKFLISSISHDLKTPVTSVRGYIDGVLDGVAGTDEKRADYLKKARAKTELIHAMIEDLLLFSRLDLNQLPFAAEKISIGEYLARFAAEYAGDFEREKKTLTFQNQLSKNCFVSLDPEQFLRVLQNISENARKNIPPETGRLDVILRERPGAVIIEMKDNGPGIRKEELLLIFDRFYRSDSARTPKGSSGLGLAIAKQIVEGQGGRIWAVSPEGAGASFFISLPREDGTFSAGETSY